MNRLLASTGFVFLLIASPAFSQTALPWKTNGSPAPAPAQGTTTTQPQHHVHATPAPSAATPSASTRDEDDHHLNMLSLQYRKISSKDPKAVLKLKSLRNEVESSYRELTKRTYDVKDIMQDTHRLDGTIIAKIKKLETPPATVSQPK